MADDGLEAHGLDLVEIIDRDLAGNRIFVIDLANVHRKYS
jgi:hypothetical protein